MLNYSSLSDNQLQASTLAGDVLAEEYLLKRYSRTVRSCARQLFLAGGEMDDLVQEGMIALHVAIVTYHEDRDASFSTYAERCIRNRLYSAIKSANRLKHNPLNEGLSIEQLSEEADSRLTAMIPQGTNPEDVLIERENKDELNGAFAKCLSRFEQNVLALYLDGSSHREIAVALEKEEKSIDNAVQRIRRKLARYLNSGEISTADRT